MMMNGQNKSELAPLFAAVEQALRQNQAALNQADPYNGNHGDHMIRIFDLATRAAQEKEADGLAEAMDHAADLLDAQPENGSAQVYGRGLRHLAEQFRRNHIDLDSLLGYVQKALSEERETPVGMAAPGSAAPANPPGAPSGGDVLKALVNGLSAWAQSEAERTNPNGADQNSVADPKTYKLNMGALFEFGMAYLQAKQRGGSRVDVLADAAASVSPLSQLPHRYMSAKLAIAALLRAMQQ